MSFALPALASLQENLSMLAFIAMRDTGADGFAYFRRHGERLERFESFGTTISEDLMSDDARDDADSRIVLSYPLRVCNVRDGAVAFAFSASTGSVAAEPRLVRYVTAIGKLWAAQSFSLIYLGTLQRIITLETGLLNAKIASIVRGALSAEPDNESGDAIIRSVETVLRPSNTIRCLDQILQELLVEIEERNWIDQAKKILHTEHGISEGEAHSRLRKLSRQSRRPLVDVARQVVHGGDFTNETGTRL